MKRLRKFLAAALVAALLSAAVAGAALAAPEDSGVAIQVNGENIDFPSGVEPYFDAEAGRVFVPVRDLFEGLGAEVEYDPDTRLITLTRGQIKVVFPQDSTEIQLEVTTETGESISGTLKSDVKPITVNNRVLVPLRFVAQALGDGVGWDSGERTAIVYDPVLFAERDTETYSVLGKLYDINSTGGGNTKSVTNIEGSFTTGGVSVPFSFEIAGVSSLTDADATISGTVGIPEGILPGISDGLPIDAQIRVGGESGLVAIKSVLLNTLYGIDPATWVTMDAYAAARGQGLDIDALLTQQTSVPEDPAEALKAAVDQMISTFFVTAAPTSVDDWENVILAQVGMIHALIGDSGFAKTDGGYESKFALEEDGTAVDISLTINADSDGKATGMAMQMRVRDGEEYVSLDADISPTQVDVTLALDIKSEDIKADVKIKSKASPTDEKPDAGVPAGAPTVEFGELYALNPVF
jgi:hypothetical protein